MLDEVGQKRGRRLRTAYVIPAEDYSASSSPDLGPFTPLLIHAMDVETWVEEGLVDDLVVHIQNVGDAGKEAGDPTSVRRAGTGYDDTDPRRPVSASPVRRFDARARHGPATRRVSTVCVSGTVRSGPSASVAGRCIVCWVIKMNWDR